MAQSGPRAVLRCLRTMVSESDLNRRSDQELLRQFVARRDESAFAELVRRHGPLVIDAARCLLHNRHDAEDVFQATFLVLVRKAGSIRKQNSLASWLYGVAYRLALKARTNAARRQARQHRTVAPTPSSAMDEITWRELRGIIHEELHRLPEKYRAPLLLCYFEGKTQEEAAGQLGWNKWTVKDRLEQARALLRIRLTRRGLIPSAALFATLLSRDAASAVPATLMEATLTAATRMATGQLLTGAVSAQAAELVELAMAHLPFTKAQLALALVITFGMIAAAAGLAAYQAKNDDRSEERTASPTKEVARAEQVSKQDQQIRTYFYGDPLPPGAIMRLGTVRLRQPSSVESIAFTVNGKQLVSAGGHEIRIWETATGKEVRRFDAINVMGFTISPTGGVLASAQNGKVSVWDLPTWEPKYSHAISTFGVAISPDGSVLATGGRSGASDPVVLWNVQTGDKLRSLSGKMPQVTRLAFSPDGKMLAAASSWNGPFSPGEGSRAEIVRVWDLATGQLHELDGHAGGVTSLAYAPDGRVLATGGHEGTICLWDTATRKRLRRIEVVEEPYFHRKGNGTDSGGVLALAFAPDGQTIALGEFDGTVRLFKAGTGKQLRILRGHAHSVGAVAFSPDGSVLASGSDDQTIRFWDPTTGALLNPRQGHDGGIERVLISPDGKRAVSAGRDRAIRFWDLTTGHELQSLRSFKSAINSISLSPDGHRLAAGLEDGSIYLHDADSGEKLRALKGHTGQIGSVSFSPDGKLLASTSPSGENSNLIRKETVRSLRLWDVNTGQELPRIEGNRNDWFARFSPDGNWLAAYRDGVDLWQPATGKKQRHFGDLDDFAFLPDGRTIAGWSPAPRQLMGGMGISSEKGKVRVRNLTDGSEIYNFDGPERMPLIGGLFVLSPDGRLLALAVREDGDFDQKVVQLWEMATGKLRRTLKGHGGELHDCAFSPHGRFLLSASSDTTVLVWDLALPLGQRPREPTQEVLASLWRDLGDADAARADQAIWRLVAAPQQALPFLQKNLRATPAPDPTRLAGLVSDLGSTQFTVRDKATRALEDLEEQAYPALHKALAGSVSPESRRRIEGLLNQLKSPLASPKTIRKVRAVETLEHIGTSAARQVLETLSTGIPDARLTQEAQASLERLARRAALKR